MDGPQTFHDFNHVCRVFYYCQTKYQLLHGVLFCKGVAQLINLEKVDPYVEVHEEKEDCTIWCSRTTQMSATRFSFPGLQEDAWTMGAYQM